MKEFIENIWCHFFYKDYLLTFVRQEGNGKNCFCVRAYNCLEAEKIGMDCMDKREEVMCLYEMKRI